MSAAQLKKWYEWIAAKPCLGCIGGPVEVAHIGLLFSNKTGQRLPRRSGPNKWAVIPLCVECHREGPRSIHNIGEKKWMEEHDIEGIKMAVVWGSWLAGFLEGEGP